MNPESVSGLFLAPKRGMVFHIESKVRVSAGANSARGGVGLNLSRSQRRLAIVDGLRIHGANGQLRRGSRTVIEAFQPGIWLVFCFLSHCVLLSIWMRLDSIHGQVGACRSVRNLRTQRNDIRSECRSICTEEIRIRGRVRCRVGCPRRVEMPRRSLIIAPRWPLIPCVGLVTRAQRQSPQASLKSICKLQLAVYFEKILR